ncbi:ubiquitin-protein ligase e3a [Lichtheimia corymbifera JMRC:FSU:9682]|uniref:HECT-type E3 ubiquitin transferase n=1 Tax=Lichtheimia corymbifera JMRC:FSU:9682 TaxID=1263082 RepID=A0A068RJY2_9FUNG|nr:ubiquitin-protein ligase e3a [Lichtheimia corymbifera JMRC:FSU:9682]
MKSSSVSVDLEVIQMLNARCQATNDWTPLVNRLFLAFGNVHLLAKSFVSVDQQPCPVDKAQAKQAFDIIQNDLPRDALKRLSGIAQSTLRCGHSMDEHASEQIHAIVILFQCPLFIDPNYTDNLLTELCESIANLSQPHQDLLVQYLIEPTNDDDKDHQALFMHLLDILHQAIHARLSHRSAISDKKVSPYQDSLVINVTKCIAILYRLNEQRHFVDYTSFYNDAINDHLEIKVDIPNYKERKGFSFCDYPFVLNATAKADILKVESVFQMRHELQDAFFRALFAGVNSPYLVLCIRREHIISDTLHQLEQKTIHDLKKQLRVQFVGEEGVDEGGVQKEFFQLIIRDLFDPKYGMFTMNEESRLYWFTPNPSQTGENTAEFKLAGLLLALAVYNSVILDLHLPLALYKKLMGVEVGLEDLKQLDPSLARGLERLLLFEGDVQAEFERSFQVDMETFGHVFTVDLKPMGGEIKLTNENKHEFVDLYAKFILNESIQKEFDAFREGFELLCHDNAINIFRPEEIEQLICGSSDLDFEALEKSTVYDGGWTKDSPIIRHFWEIVHEFSYEEKKKLLFFATGSDRAPIGGLGKLQFVIAKNGADSDRLPTSHTCYNVLLLCEYNSKEKLRERLMTSISNAEGFGMI